MGVAYNIDVSTLKRALTTPDALAFKILELPEEAVEALEGLWSTFTGKELELFTRRLKHYTSVVCCLSSEPGWVWCVIALAGG